MGWPVVVVSLVIAAAGWAIYTTALGITGPRVMVALAILAVAFIIREVLR